MLGIGRWNGGFAWSEIIWAVVLVAIFHVVLTKTRWGLHTIAVGGNQLGAAESGVNVARIKYGNFMLCAVLGGFVGLQIAFQTNLIDTFAGEAPTSRCSTRWPPRSSAVRRCSAGPAP